MGGWIKLHRCLLENPIVMKDADHLAVWTYLLLEATHKDIQKLFKGKKITLKPGQLITGRIVISDTLKISESKVRRILNEFESDHQIDRQRSNKNSLITVLNWDLYQSADQQDDQQVTNKRPTSDQQVTTLQEYKEDKEDKNNITSNKSDELDLAFDKIYYKYPKKVGKSKAKQIYKALLTKGRKIDGKTVKFTHEDICAGLNVYYNDKTEPNNGEIGDTKYWMNFDTLMNRIQDYVERREELDE